MRRGRSLAPPGYAAAKVAEREPPRRRIAMCRLNDRNLPRFHGADTEPRTSSRPAHAVFLAAQLLDSLRLDRRNARCYAASRERSRRGRAPAHKRLTYPLV